MIQRIQSIYLLASALLILGSFATSFIEFSNNFGVISVTPLSITDSESIFFSSSPNIYTLGISIAITAIANIITIFLFKNRMLQLKVVRYTIILKIAILGIIGYFAYLIGSSEQLFKITPKAGTLFIFITIILDWLAYKAIKKDEDLVRSVDRIR